MTKEISRLPVLASGSGLDIRTATDVELRRELTSLVAAARKGWLDRTFQKTVVLKETTKQIYSLDKDSYKDRISGEWKTRGVKDKAWSVQGAGFDEISHWSGMSIAVVDEVTKWDGAMPETVHYKALAVGNNALGAVVAVSVRLTMHGLHYRLEQMQKAATRWVGKGNSRQEVRVDGFDFGPRGWLIEQGKLGKPSQIFLRQETIGDGADAADIGYSLDYEEPAVSKVMRGGATFAKNFERRALTVVRRLASQKWYGISTLDPQFISAEDGCAVAHFPLIGWRSELKRGQVEAIAEGMSRGLGTAESLSGAGISDAEIIDAEVVEDPASPPEEEEEESEGYVPGIDPQQDSAPADVTDAAPDQTAPPPDDDDPRDYDEETGEVYTDNAPPPFDDSQMVTETAEDKRRPVQVKTDIRETLICIKDQTGKGYHEVLENLGQGVGIPTYEDLAHKSGDQLRALERILKAFINEGPEVDEKGAVL